METTLYKRDAKGNILKWRIRTLIDDKLEVAYGLYNGVLHTEVINTTKKKVNEFDSRVTAKRKEGYKALEDVYDNSPVEGMDKDTLYNYLNTYLPKYNTTSDGFILPMLAKTLEDNKPFEKFGIMMGQWKINGLRCIIGAEKHDGDLFKNHRYTYTSREGTKWNLSWMDEVLNKYISISLLEAMIEEGVCLDGELYLPGYSVNDINSFVKNSSLPQHYKLQYWCYDLCWENMSAVKRNHNRTTLIHLPVNSFILKTSHLNNIDRFVLLPTTLISNIQEAITKRNIYIDLGFEGLILRNPNAEYAFGKRNNAMFKFKKKEDGLFEIIDIKEDKRGFPIYVLKNDINAEYFECTINLPQDKQREHLKIKSLLVGKKGLVEYRERSGVKQVPFHAKLIKIQI